MSISNGTAFLTHVSSAGHSLNPQADRYHCYLTYTSGIVPPTSVHRSIAKHIHCDGFVGARHAPGSVDVDYIFSMSSCLPTVHYPTSMETSGLDLAKDDFCRFFEHHADEGSTYQGAYEMSLMDGYALHRSPTNHLPYPVHRHFLRLIYSTRSYSDGQTTHAAVNPMFAYEWCVCGQAWLSRTSHNCLEQASTRLWLRSLPVLSGLCRIHLWRAP